MRSPRLLIRTVALACCAPLCLAPAAATDTPPTPRPKPQIKTIESLIEEVTVPTAADPGQAPTAVDPAPPARAADPTVASRSSTGPRPKPRDVAPTRVLSPAEHKVFAAALDAALRDDFRSASATADKLADPTAKTLIEWLYVRSSALEAGATRIADFLEKHPDWPDASVLRTRAEASLLVAADSPGATVGYFAKYPPTTGTGRIVLAEAYFRTGDKAKAEALIQAAWREDELSAALESRAIALCGACVTDALDKERLDRMAYRGKFKAASRAAKRLGSAHVTLVNARSAIAERSRHAAKRYSQAAKQYEDDVGLALSRVTWLRRNDKDAEARRILLAAPSSAEAMLEPQAWWTERRLVARRALGTPDALRDAYKITAAHGLTAGGAFADAEFLAGWIALRRIGDAALAAKHFRRLRDAVETPISVARAEYWLGRAAEQLGNSGEARGHFEAAARHGVTYYGQLAREKIAGRDAKLDLPKIDAATWRAGAAIEDNPLMKAARLLAAAGERHLASRFLRHLAWRTSDPGALDRLAVAANVLALPQVSVRIGKAGILRGAPVHDVAYPIGDYPEIDPAPEVERALLLALTRQESEFNWQASSHAGARGLMQVMPATGKMLARQSGVEFSLKRLGEDPQYNASLGAKFIADLIAEFGGSYVLAIASYNAGPGRVGDWIGMLGDPRDQAVDPIDWIETIPFDETRNYVQRVLENLQVYRARLAGAPVLLRLTADIARGRGTVGKRAAND